MGAHPALILEWIVVSESPVVSIEVPVFKGRYLAACIRSVLRQTSPRWQLSLAWDGGDAHSRRLLERVSRWNHPQIHVSFKAREGIGRTRRFLTEGSTAPWILPLDDDDMLVDWAIERFIAAVGEKPWAGIFRARRHYVDDKGTLLDNPNDIFPFGPRRYECGLVSDVWNFSQPYLIRRSAYSMTSGWTGYDDFAGAGEDGAISLEVEEVAGIELIDDVLYHYRINPLRTSLAYDKEDAYELMRRLADAAIQRTGLDVRRINDIPPYRYERIARDPATLADVAFVVPAPPELHARAAGWREALLSYGVRADALIMEAGPIAASWLSGFRATSSRIVALVHPETEPPPAEVVLHLLGILNDVEVDLVSPIVVTEDGQELFARSTIDGAEPRRLGSRGDVPRLRRAEWVGPALVFAKRGALRAVSGPDSSMQPELAVMDLCLRLRKRGLTCMETNDAQVIFRDPPACGPLTGFPEYWRRWRGTTLSP